MPLKTLFIAAYLIVASFNYALAQDTNLKIICTRIDKLNTAIRDNHIKKKDAVAEFKKLITEVKTNAVTINDNTDWIFPVQGYNYKAIGGNNGNGYSDKGYNYLDGNKHLAHPAHDIFIADRNQDGIDDHTQHPVSILAVADGVVISSCNEWQPNSTLRGGKYIWIYHPKQNAITYYAHNREIMVAPGDIVHQGQKIAEMGRTGFNANKKRSPTHLHFGAYSLVNDLPIPYNTYAQLVKTQKR